MGICRVELFFNQIKNLKKIYEIELVCQKEYAYLHSSYNTVASLKSAFSVYRNYLKKVLGFNSLVEGKAVLELLLTVFRLTDLEQYEYTKNKHQQIVNDRSNLRAITDVDKYLDVSISLLSSNSYLDKILGLCALSGRRSAEIACSASLEYVDNETVLFSGQLKLKSRTIENYPIPVLHDAKVLIDALESLRQAKPEFINNPAKFHSVASSDLCKKVKKFYVLCFEGVPKVKDLRAIYVEICHHLFCKDRSLAKQQFYSNILGHDKDDSAISEAYADFYINDPNLI